MQYNNSKSNRNINSDSTVKQKFEQKSEQHQTLFSLVRNKLSAAVSIGFR